MADNERPTYEEFRKKLDAKPGFREAFEVMGPEAQVKNMLIDARMAAGLDIEQVAERMGVSEEAACEIEEFGSGIPSLANMQAYLAAVGHELKFESAVEIEGGQWRLSHVAMVAAKAEVA